MLDNSQKDAIGLTFVLNQLAPSSPYGKEKLKELRFLDKQGLEKSFHNIEQVLYCIKEHSNHIETLKLYLSDLKNIRQSIARSNVNTLHQIELFEIKQFLLTYEKLLNTFNLLAKNVTFVDINLQPMTQVLTILDPKEQRVASFMLDSPALEVIRKEKLQIEAELTTANDESTRSLLSTKRRELVAKEEAEEANKAKELTEHIKQYVALFFENMYNIAELDFAIAKGSIALKYSATKPTIAQKLALTNMANPYVEYALAKQGKHITKVSIDLPQGVTIITGANMGGKSISIKTTVLNILLCRMGLFVFAEQAHIPMFDDVYLISEDMQDIGKGLSSFGAEMLFFNSIAKQIKTKFLFIALDEFARGTNPEEGGTIVKAVASYLSKTTSICVMTTHYDKIASPLFKHYQVAGLDLAKAKHELGDINDISHISQYMDYTLVEVSSATKPPRDALNICRLIGLDEDILNHIEEAL